MNPDKLLLRIGKRKKTYEVTDLADASLTYQRVRDESGEGGSTFPPGTVFGLPDPHYISYNGRVWKGTPRGWKEGMTPVMEAAQDPRLTAAKELDRCYSEADHGIVTSGSDEEFEDEWEILRKAGLSRGQP